MFGATVPQINIGGKLEVKTSIGAIGSIVIMLLTAGYALIKLQFMLLRKRPDVIKFVETDAFDETVKFKTNENDFMIAASAENWLYGPRVDPRYL